MRVCDRCRGEQGVQSVWFETRGLNDDEWRTLNAGDLCAACRLAILEPLAKLLAEHGVKPQ